MKNQIKEIIQEAVKKAFPEIETLDFKVEYADKRFGDYSTNVAMILGKRIGKSPEEIAKKIIKRIGESEIIEEVEVAGPGFINFKMSLPYWQQKIAEILAKGNDFGRTDLGSGLKVNIEFISANPTGPLTVGNSRGGVIGDVLANVLIKAGWQTIREYYFNDEGSQIDILGHSVLKDSEAQYKGDYIDKLNEEITDKNFRQIGKLAAQKLIKEIKKTTKNMGINFDVWFAEGKDLRAQGKVGAIIDWMKKNNLAYKKDGAIWFRSTDFGDDKDRVVVRSNNEPTYFGVDCAYHQNKFVTRKFDKVIDVWGADHHGDVARIKGFVKALGFDKKFDILLHQFVRIVVEGKEVRMSKRSGQYILVDDLLKEVGKDVYRFFMLQYAPNSHLTFDLKLAKEKSEKNPVYYVQYANARIYGILEKLKTPAFAKAMVGKQNLKLLKEPAEIALIKELTKLPELIAEIAGNYQVQKLSFYALRLAERFHEFYEKCPIVKAKPDLKMARIGLILATQIVLKNTLNLLGISAPEKM